MFKNIRKQLIFTCLFFFFLDTVKAYVLNLHIYIMMIVCISWTLSVHISCGDCVVIESHRSIKES